LRGWSVVQVTRVERRSVFALRAWLLPHAMQKTSGPTTPMLKKTSKNTRFVCIRGVASPQEKKTNTHPGVLSARAQNPQHEGHREGDGTNPASSKPASYTGGRGTAQTQPRPKGNSSNPASSKRNREGNGTNPASSTPASSTGGNLVKVWGWGLKLQGLVSLVLC